MVHIMKVYMRMVKNMEKVYLFGMMVVNMKENFLKIIFMDKVFIHGQMDVNT